MHHLAGFMHNSPRTMTEVVPSPTSSSCVRLSSIMDCGHPRKMLRAEKEGITTSVQQEYNFQDVNGNRIHKIAFKKQ